MPRFFFDVIDNGIAAVDDKGLELDGLDIAERQVAIAVVETMPARSSFWGETVTVVIRDESRQALARVMVTLNRERLS
jgi:hypothetical protein